MSAVAGSSVVGPAGHLEMTVFCMSWVPAESCVMACYMAVITFLACHRQLPRGSL